MSGLSITAWSRDRDQQLIANTPKVGSRSSLRKPEAPKRDDPDKEQCIKKRQTNSTLGNIPRAGPTLQAVGFKGAAAGWKRMEMPPVTAGPLATFPRPCASFALCSGTPSTPRSDTTAPSTGAIPTMLCQGEQSPSPASPQGREGSGRSLGVLLPPPPPPSPSSLCPPVPLLLRKHTFLQLKEGSTVCSQ